MLGQVWTKADCNGIRELGHGGGVGSVLAVTAQNPGFDRTWGTIDDLNAPMNQKPAALTIDRNPDDNCEDLGDRVRGFAGQHTSGVLFVFADGSAKLIADSTEAQPYRAQSTINGSEAL